jgi:Fic family protein
MQKKYEKSHPWINFNIDTQKANLFTWLFLGEAQSKCAHIAGTLLDPKIAKKLNTLYLIKGTRATTAIEGNTLTEDQVRDIINGEADIPPSKKYQEQEIINISDAYNQIAHELLTAGSAPVTVAEIKKYNEAVLHNLKLEECVIPGKIRTYPVGVGRYAGAPYEDCEYLLERLCAMLQQPAFNLGNQWTYASGILKAVLAHLFIAWVHPFGDGNGRTARLVEFKICLMAGIPTLAAHLLSNHYNETRAEYYRKLDETSKHRNVFPFVTYALQGYVDQLDFQLGIIRQEQHKAFWINYVHNTFKGLNDTPTNSRRKRLMLRISEKAFDTWMPEQEIYLGMQLTESKKATLRTLARDLSVLIKEQLVLKKGNKVKANTGIIEVYLPKKAENRA